MFYDVRTLDLRPHSVPEVERRLAAALEERRILSTLAACFHTEIGPLNQIVQIWEYEDLAERERHLADDTAASGSGEFVIAERSEVFVPFAISPRITPGAPGPFFEIRTYTYADGDLPKIVTAWEAALPERLALGPLVVVGSSERGGVNKLLHIWPYRSLDERWELRRRIREAGAWPPLAVARKRGLAEYTLLHMENKIALPSVYSPLQ
jgi:hypothetical protein